MRERSPCVYILASGPRGTIYIGVTSDLPGRIHQHRNNVTKGFASKYQHDGCGLWGWDHPSMLTPSDALTSPPSTVIVSPTT